MLRSHSLARVLGVAALMVSALVPIAPRALAGNPGPALSECAPTVSCARFTISLGGSGSGFAESSDITTGVPDGHIDCHLDNGVQTGACSYLYSWPAGTATYKIHLDAAPAMGNVVCFTTGTCLAEGYSTPLPFTLTNGSPTTYAISFRKALRTLDVQVVFEGGTPQSHVVKATNILSIDCPPTCSFSYDYGDQVELVASTTVNGFIFVGGFGACSGIKSVCDLSMTDNLSAGFTYVPFTVVTPSPKVTTAPKATPKATSGSGASPASSGASSNPVASSNPASVPASSPSMSPLPPSMSPPLPTGQGTASPTGSTGADPLVIGLLGVIAVLLVVISIGLVISIRRRSA